MPAAPFAGPAGSPAERALALRRLALRRLATDRLAPRPLAGRSVVLYDRDCAFCTWLLAGLLRLDRGERLHPIALQRPEADELLAELAPAERIASWHLITSAGERFSAGAAFAPLLELLPRGRVAAAVIARVPRLTERGYRWVAAHRSQLSRLVPSRAKRRASERVRLRERTLQARPTP
jgi:predicted DCC family thiol-disulfide oxidoreductase YuxK